MSDATIEVWESDDGDWYAIGHIDKEAFVAACRTSCIENCGEEEAKRLDWDYDQANIRHVWYWDDGTDNDDSWRKCEADHPDAKPLTEWVW